MQFDEETGKTEKGQDIDPETGQTVIVDKPRIGKPPCETKDGCLKGHWSQPLLGPRELQFLRVYHEAKGMGCWPEGWAADGVVRTLAGVIDRATSDAQAIQADIGRARPSSSRSFARSDEYAAHST